MLPIVFREQWTTPDIGKAIWDFPGSPVVKNPRAIAEDTGYIPGPEDSTCLRATNSMHHNYQDCALEPMNHNYWSP